MVELSGDGAVPGVRVREHTADVRLEAEGATLAECLARLAAGVFALVFVPPEPSPARAIEVDVEVDVEAEDERELAVAWLEELLYRSDVEDLVPVRFEVETDGRRLRGRAAGVPLTAGVEVRGPHVKAVTRHDLEVRRADGGWLARVVLDV